MEPKRTVPTAVHDSAPPGGVQKPQFSSEGGENKDGGAAEVFTDVAPSSSSSSPERSRGGASGGSLAETERERGWRSRQLCHIRNNNGRTLVVALVGLPARGKTYMGRKVARYLQWLGYRTRVFNTGVYRRKLCGPKQKHGFFDPSNKEASAKRQQCWDAALDDMITFLTKGRGEAAVYDATNCTRERRRYINQRLQNSPARGELIWIESICTNRNIILRNILRTKLRMPDYQNVKAEEALTDFMKRIECYEKVYEPLTEDEVGMEEGFVKIYNTGMKVTTYGIKGYLPGRLVFFLMNLQVSKQPIYFSRHGQSELNVVARLGGDSNLSDAGRKYAEALGTFYRKEMDEWRQGERARLLQQQTELQSLCGGEAKELPPLRLPDSSSQLTRHVVCGVMATPTEDSQTSAGGGTDQQNPEEQSRSPSPSVASPSLSYSENEDRSSNHEPAEGVTPSTDRRSNKVLKRTPLGHPSGIGRCRVNSVDEVSEVDLRVWCSTLRRTIQTASAVCKRLEPRRAPVIWHALQEINAGVYDSLTYAEVKEKDPVGFAARSKDKLRYRYPQGESYIDVIHRVEPVIFGLERAETPVLVVGHQAVLRCLYGYFLDLPLDELPHLSIPLHTVIKLTALAYETEEERYVLNEETGKLERQLNLRSRGGKLQTDI